MTIVELLQNDDYPTRITCGWRWLVGTGVGWNVYERKPYAKKTTVVCVTKDEEKAVAALLED